MLKTSSDTSRIAPIIYGLIGYGAGIEFLSYVKVYEKLPDVQAIYRGEYPSVDKSKPALLYALVSALVELYRGGAEASKHLFGFAQSLPTEFGVMLIKDAIVKDASIDIFSYIPVRLFTKFFQVSIKLYITIINIAYK